MMVLTPEEFITIWQTAKSKNDVRAATGMTEFAINTRAARYRRNGIPLRRFKTGPGFAVKANLDTLIALAQSLEPMETNHDNQPT